MSLVVRAPVDYCTRRVLSSVAACILLSTFLLMLFAQHAYLLKYIGLIFERGAPRNVADALRAPL